MKTVVLDGYCANPGDLGWDWLGRFGSCTVYDRTPAAETAGRIGDAEAVLTNKTVIDRAVMANCPGLRYIGVMATGYNVIDLEAARERGIVVTNVPGYSTDSVAQLTFAMMLYFANRVDCFNDWVKQGGWQACPDFSRLVTPIFELAGKTVGIIGFGDVQRRQGDAAAAHHGLPGGVEHIAAQGADVELGAKQVGRTVPVDDGLALHQLEHADAQSRRQRLQQGNIGQAAGCLPLGDGLCADGQLFGQHCLRHVFGFPQLPDGSAGDVRIHINSPL